MVRIRYAELVPLSTRSPLPAWTRGAVAYGVIPPLFGERPLRAVTEHLDEFHDMGVDALWLSPIMASDDESMISYGLTDFQAIRPEFGTPRDLKKLVQGAHQRGMKVLLDIPPNHVSEEHEYYQSVLDEGKNSPYYDWFDRDAQGNVTTYFDWDHLKNLNFAKPEVQKLVTDAFEHWVKTYDVDGFRVDAAWGPAERQPEFWHGLNEKLQALKPDVFLLAEASARDPYFVNNGFHSAYDWGEEMGEWAWNGVFDDPSQIGARLDTALRHPSGTPMSQIAHFLNNNDTGQRFITRFGPTRTRAAASLLLTLPGIPIVYTGDEVGAEFQPYDDPPPLDWKDPHDLKPLYRALIHLRQEVPALAAGDFQPVSVAGEGSGAAYAFRRDLPGADSAVVMINFGDTPARLKVNLPPGEQWARWRDLLSGATGTASELTLAAGGCQILTPAPAPALDREAEPGWNLFQA